MSKDFPFLQSFPPDFIWGAATSSYQIEGAWNEDGKGESIWDRFSHAPGNIDGNDTGDIAADHYHRWQEDIRLMKEIGIRSYRFSISWPRILPEGRGRLEKAGLDFYDKLVDGLLEADIDPMITLYHWDLPQALQDEGGWTVRSVVDAFTEYADVVTRKLADRVRLWATFNEPFVSAWLGYMDGTHAPGHQDVDEMLAASHHLLLSHGSAVPVMRSNAPDAEVGIVLNLAGKVPASNSYDDRAAAYVIDGRQNRWYLDPIAGRGYPGDMVKYYDRKMDFIQPGDMEMIAEPIDFLGINHYRREIIRAAEVEEEMNWPVTVHHSGKSTAMDWEVYPPGLYQILTRVHHSYHFPKIYVTENGAAFVDTVDPDGQIDDQQRVEFLQEYLFYAAQAIDHGVPLAGYYVWSLMDNFEWARGYDKRFGIIHIDFETQERRLKNSALWYKKLISSYHSD